MRSPTRSLPSSTTARQRPSSSTTTTSISRRASSASARPDALLAQFVHIPWPQSDGWTVLPEAAPRARCTTGCSRTTSSGSTRGGGAGTSRRAPPTSSGRERTADGRLDASRAERRPSRLAPISIDVAEFDDARAPSRDGARRRGTHRRGCGRERLVVRVDRTDPSKNIVRGFRAFGLLLDASSRVAAAVSRCSRCSTRRGRTSRSTSTTSLRSSARLPPSTTRFGSGGLAAGRPADRRRLPALGRGLQAVRRPARERRLRRAEPRREGRRRW